MADKRSFEEQVRGQLADFTLKPDAEVWENVGSALKEDKKRRWMIWMFFFAVAGSAATYWAYHSSEQPKVVAAKNIVAEKNEKVNQPVDLKKDNAGIPTVTEYNNPTVLTGEQKPVEESKKISVRLATALQKGKPVFSKTKNSNPSTNSLEANSNNVPAAEKTTVSQSTAGSTEALVSTGNTEVTKAIVSTEHATASPDTSSISPLAVTDKKTVTAKAKRPWKLNAIIDIGRSGSVSTQASVSPPLFAAGSPNSSFNNGLQNNGSYSGNATPAFSYRLGLEAQKAIGKKWDIGFSLAYQSFTTKINVGKKVDSLLSFQKAGNGGYYMAGNDKVYTNHYQFLQAGISVYRHFTLAKKLSLRWQIGVEGNWLFSSNSLYSTSSLLILYNDRDLNNKVQTSISTAFEFGVGKTPFLYVGPGINYFITGYDKASAVYSVRHLWNLGLNMHVPLSEKR